MTTRPVTSITDEQLAELERAALAKKSEGFLLVHNLSCNDMLALITRLRAAEADAARYRWLRGKFGIMGNNVSLPCGYRSEESIAQMALEADSAIDTAMERNP